MVPFLVCTACVFDLNLTIGTREVSRPKAYVKPYGLIKFRPKKLNSHHWIALKEVIEKLPTLFQTVCLGSSVKRGSLYNLARFAVLLGARSAGLEPATFSVRSHSPSGTRALLAVRLIRLLRVLSVASASCEPGIELGAVIAGSALGEVVSGDPLPGCYLLERLDRLAPKVLGGLLRGHPLG